MRALDGRNAAQKRQVILLSLTTLVLRNINAVMNGLQVRHGFLNPLEIADGDVMDFGEIAVELAQFRYMRMVQRGNERTVDEPRADQAGCIIDMNNIAGTRRVLDGPGGVVQVFEVVVNFAFDWPLRLGKEPAGFRIHSGFPIGIDHNVHSRIPQPRSQLCDEQFGAAIARGWDTYKGWRDDRYSH